MELFSLLWQVFAFIIVTIIEIVTKVGDEVMFTLEDNEVYGKIVKPPLDYLFLHWKLLFLAGTCNHGTYRYLRRLANSFPAPPIVAKLGPSMEQFLEERESTLNAAVGQKDNLDRENAAFRAQVGRLHTEVDHISEDRYALVHENLILQNRLGDFNSWPEFRIEYDQLTAELVAMKRQRTREHILQERTLQIAKETKAELAAAKRAETMSKIAHREELEQVQQERDELKEKYQTLLASAATTAPAMTSPSVAAVTAATTAITANTTATAVVTGDTPGDFDLQAESTRLTLVLCSRSSILSKLFSDLDRLQSLLKSRSKQCAFYLNMAALTITALEETKAKAEERVPGFERDVQEAKAKTHEMEERYMAVAFGDEGEASAGAERDESGSEDGEEEDQDDKCADGDGNQDDDDGEEE